MAENPKIDDQPDDKAIAHRRDEALKRALGTPHKPHVPKTKQKKKSPNK